MKIYVHLWSYLAEFLFFLFVAKPPPWARASSFTMFRDYTQRRTTVGRTPLDKWSALRDNTQHLQDTDIHASGGIRTHNLSRRAAADLRLRPRGHWDRRIPLTIRKFWDKCCRENQNAHFLCTNIFPKLVRFVRYCGKIWQSQTDHRWDLHAVQLSQDYRHTQRNI